MHPKEAAYVSELAEQDLVDIAHFLFGLKAKQGAAASPMPPEGNSQFINSMLKMMAPAEWDEKYQDVRDKAPESAE
jgi:hypothetical protein